MKTNQTQNKLFLMGLLLVVTAVFATLLLIPTSHAQDSDQSEPQSVTASPTIPFSTYYGGSLHECQFEPCAITTDANGNIYFAGTTNSTDFPMTHPFTTTVDIPSIFVVKLAANTHNVLYSTYLGEGKARGIAVDNNGNAYITGESASDDFPTTPNAIHTSRQGATDAVAAKLSSDGSQLLYSTYLGGTSYDGGFDIAVDSASNIYITGVTQSNDFDTMNAAQATYGAGTDAFVTKIAANGSLAYSTYLGGSRDDRGWGIAIDSNSNAYVTGRSGSDNFPTTAGVVQPTRYSGAGSDAIVVKLTANGAFAYSTFYATGSANNGIDIAVDAHGNAHVISTHEGVFKLNANATAIAYRTGFISSDIAVNVDGEGGIALDSRGVAYVVGWRGSGSNKDIVVLAFAPGGQRIYERTLGGSDSDLGYSIAIHEDNNGHIDAYVLGDTESTDFPTTNPIQVNNDGQKDLAVFNISGLENLPSNFSYLPMIIK